MAEPASLAYSFRRRLIGVVAVVVISVAIAPLLFDAAGYKERHIENRIPPAPPSFPVMEVTPINQPTGSSDEPAAVAPPVELVPPQDKVLKEIPAQVSEFSQSVDTPRLDQDGIPVAWSLQLASFRDERNAKALRADLIKAGYKVYIRHSDELVRVYIGPEMQRTRLEKLQETIRKDYSLDGMIVRFTTE